MADLDLPAIAQSVATALGEALLSEHPSFGHQVEHGLYADGSNLTDPYWRCACLDWLNANQWDAHTAATCGPHWAAYLPLIHRKRVEVHCPAALASAALVHEVVKARG